jgi:acetyl-CoA carboxylase carboxyltransferase component
MVGPDIEVRAQVRHVCRMFVNGAHVTVPYFTIILRRGYGLGVMAMAKAASTNPSSPRPGRPRNSAAWAWRAR